MKQRLIGAAVITALAAIFVPMLFDDVVDETGKSVNELKIPEMPAKAQEVEIMPLPEKAEDVATVIPVEKSPKPVPKNLYDEGQGEVVAPPRPQKIIAEAPVANQRPIKVIEPDPDMGQVDPDGAMPDDGDFSPSTNKPAKLPTQQLPQTTTTPVVKPIAPVTAIPAPSTVVATPKPNVGNEAATRWYLNAGSFSQKANATALQENLKQQGFAASIKEANGEKGIVYRVRIGPILDKAKAQAVKNKLTQINVNTFVATEE
ncbi:MAG: SPOR domain-containing protein [Methylomonas sp.]